jgi:hypothetical protein
MSMFMANDPLVEDAVDNRQVFEPKSANDETVGFKGVLVHEFISG